MVLVQLKPSKDKMANAKNLVPEVVPLQKSILCADSEFFRAATKPEWQGSTPYTVDLTQEDPDAFKVYAHFLYTKTILFQPQRSEALKVGPWDILIRAYLLGEKLLSRNFRNAIVEEYITYHNQTEGHPDLYLIKAIYNGTTSTSPFRKLIVDLWAAWAETFWNHDDIVQATCEEFVQDLLAAILRLRPSLNRRTSILVPSVYYVKDTK